MMANVAVRNWRFLYDMGLTGCRWFDGQVGNYTEVRKLAVTGAVDPTFSPDSPIVLSLKVLYSYPGLSTEEQGNRGRGELLATSFAEYERRVRQQFTDMFGAHGFDAKRDIAGIILNRWGYVYRAPSRIFLWNKWQTCAPRNSTEGPVWPHRFCQHRSCRCDGPSILNPRRAARRGSDPLAKRIIARQFAELRRAASNHSNA